MKLFYRELGEGRPVVVMHGLFGSSDNLLSSAKMLAENYKVFLVDARNHGQSPHSDDFTYTAMAEDLKEFVTDHKIGNPIMIGHSMGGKAVMKFASLHEDLAEKFVVMDISPRFYNRHHDEILAGLNSIDLANLKSRQEADVQLSRYIGDIGVRQFLLKNLDRAENGFQWRINLPVITDKIENIGEPLDENAQINKPTLFVKGANSRYIQEKDEALIHKIFTNARLVTIEGAGHWLHAEKPKEFVDAVKTFIEAS